MPGTIISGAIITIAHY